MQCPSCEHEAPQVDFGDPLRCPDCGAFYEKALEIKLRKATAQPRPPQLEQANRGAAPTPYTNGLVPCRSCRAPISKKAAACPHCGALAKKKTSVVTWIVAIIAGLWLIGFIANLSNSPGGGSPSVAGTSAAPAPRLSPLEQAKASTELVDFDWRKKAGGSLMQADFTIRNSGTVAVKDIEIQCTHVGPSGTQIDSNKRTIYEIVGAGKTRTFKDFDMGFIHSQATKTNCVIKSLSI